MDGCPATAWKPAAYQALVVSAAIDPPARRRTRYRRPRAGRSPLGTGEAERAARSRWQRLRDAQRDISS